MSDRTKQVQFRMPGNIHKELKKALIDDDSSLADFFNSAAENFLKEKGIEITDKELIGAGDIK